MTRSGLEAFLRKSAGRRFLKNSATDVTYLSLPRRRPTARAKTVANFAAPQPALTLKAALLIAATCVNNAAALQTKPLCFCQIKIIFPRTSSACAFERPIRSAS